MIICHIFPEPEGLEASVLQDFICYGNNRISTLSHHAFYQAGLIVKGDTEPFQPHQIAQRPEEPTPAISPTPSRQVSILPSHSLLLPGFGKPYVQVEAKALRRQSFEFFRALYWKLDKVRHA